MTRSYGLTLEDLEESLSEILPPCFEIKIIKNKIIINTNLIENSYGELVPLEDGQEEDDEDDDLDPDIDGLGEDYLEADLDSDD